MSKVLNILIVDDSMSMRYITNEIVMELGHQVVGEAIDGKEAIQKYKELKPDVVLLDLVMPIIDGKKALKKIMSMDNEAKVIICSSLGAEQDVEYCLRAGAFSYLQKPYDEEGIKNALDQIPETVEN